MKKLSAVLIAALFATGAAFAASHVKEEKMKKPTAAECKKAMKDKKELKGCEDKKKKEMKDEAKK